jgi:L,D-peptidoglycan transpeptidase YkuD (ErfK/YbiS/YcfS/YnhG family)
MVNRPARVPGFFSARRAQRICVRVLSHSSSRGIIQLGATSLPCALGRSGIKALKREGDGASPLGTWPLERGLLRPDRCRRPFTGLPFRSLSPDDGWCDASVDRNYNRRVKLPYPASAERLWRPDSLYDLIIVLDHNRSRRRRNCGSAIFMHVAREGYRPTEGCIALSRGDLVRLLAKLSLPASISVGVQVDRPLNERIPDRQSRRGWMPSPRQRPRKATAGPKGGGPWARPDLRYCRLARRAR